MKPQIQIIYDGKSLDGDRPSSFEEDAANAYLVAAMATGVAIAPIAIAVGAVGCVAVAGGFAVRTGIDSLKGKKQ